MTLDHSALDLRRFVDHEHHNCPFCKRNHVPFRLETPTTFDWSPQKECWIYKVGCQSCGLKSMHLSWDEIHYYSNRGYAFDSQLDNIDSHMFTSIPSGSLVIDGRIPKVLRELLSEAECCTQANFLTGATACARKVVYELAKKERAEGDNYAERLKSLKTKLPHVEPVHFDTLVAIHDLTSSKVHEHAHDAWSGKHLKAILETIRVVLVEIYVLPKERERRKASIEKLRTELLTGYPPASPELESVDPSEDADHLLPEGEFDASSESSS